MYLFELPNNGKNRDLRVVGAIHDGFLFHIEEENNNYYGHQFVVWVVEAGNEFTQKRNLFFNRKRLFTAKTIAEVKKKIPEYMLKYPGAFEKEDDTKSYPVAALPGGNNSDFYPTPLKLAGKMLSCVDWKNVRSILEPSAGKGDLVAAVEKMVADRQYHKKFSAPAELCRNTRDCFDVIESDYNLRLILRGKELRLVDDDFLHFSTQKRYDLILMNPPFSEGVRHLVKAIGMIKNGGQVVCLLNAESIRNPYNNERKLLQNLLAENNARIEFVRDAFKNAERKTDVEVAIIYINIPKKVRESDIFKDAEKAAQVDFEAQHPDNDHYMVVGDEVEALIQHYNAEARAGIKLLEAYNDLAPYIMDGKDEYAKPLIQISIHGHDYPGVSNATVNEYLERLRLKYWQLFLNRPALQNKLTSGMASEYADKIRDMAQYEFNRHNVMQVLFDIQQQLVVGVEESILSLFDQLSSRYCTENEKNIHYYNGWKTNKAHAVGMKAILPVNGFSAYSWDKNKLDEYQIYSVISDLEKSLRYLDKGEVNTFFDIAGAIRTANINGMTTLALSYFDCRFYKKGTCHITFRDETKPILDRLNIFAGRNKGWLPPSYGRKQYRDMDAEERAVIDDFQGKDAYDKIMADPGKYLIDRTSLQPMLTA